MRSIVGMAAQYTEVTLEDMSRFLNRGFHALDPKKGAQRGEILFDLHFSPRVGVRVWSSIPASGTSGAGVGQDAIRVQFFHFAKNHPLQSGKAPIVKRTQGWRDSLTDKIEELMEKYDDSEEYWER